MLGLKNYQLVTGIAIKKYLAGSGVTKFVLMMLLKKNVFNVKGYHGNMDGRALLTTYLIGSGNYKNIVIVIQRSRSPNVVRFSLGSYRTGKTRYNTGQAVSTTQHSIMRSSQTSRRPRFPLHLNVERPFVWVQYASVGTEVEAVGERPGPPACRLRLLQPRPDTTRHSGGQLHSPKLAGNTGRARLRAGNVGKCDDER